MSRANHRTTKPSQRPVPVAGAWETFYPAAVDTSTMANPCLRYDFLQRKLVLNTEALRYLRSNMVRITADRQKYTLRIVPIHGIDTHCIQLERTGSIKNPLSLMQWLRMDTNNRSLVGVLPLVPTGTGYLEAVYYDLITRRAAAVADEIAHAAESSCVAATG